MSLLHTIKVGDAGYLLH